MATDTPTTPLVGATVEIKAAHVIDSSMTTGEVVAIGHGDGVWIRFADGTENWFPGYAFERLADLGRKVTSHHRALLDKLPQPERPSENWLRQARVEAEVCGDSAEADRLTREIVKLTQTGPFFPADAVAPF